MELRKQFWKEVKAHCDKGRVAYRSYGTVLLISLAKFYFKI